MRLYEIHVRRILTLCFPLCRTLSWCKLLSELLVRNLPVRTASETYTNFDPSHRYKRSEFGIRAAIFFSAAALAGSFGGLLAAGIAQMGGVGGKPGWAWIFVSDPYIPLFMVPMYC